MKKLFVILLSMIIVVSASAQRKFGGHVYVPRTRVVVGVGAGYYPWYSPYAYPYGYWGYGYPYYYGRPSRLELKVEDIRADYRDRIWSARHDKSLSRAQRKTEIRQLKSERDAAIRDAERNYHRTY